MLSAKNVFVLTESRLQVDGFYTPRFLIYYFSLFCYNQDGSLKSSSCFELEIEHDIIYKPLLIKQ